MKRTNSRFLSPSGAVLAAGLLSACLGPQPRTIETRVEPVARGSGEEAPEVVRPVSLRINNTHRAAAMPEGITAFAVPAIVTEPAPTFGQAPEQLGAAASSGPEIIAMDVPGPARATPKGRGHQLNQISASASQQPGFDLNAATSLPVVANDPPAPLAPPLTTSFDSLDFDDNSTLTGGSIFIPPDAHAAVGINHVVAVVNTTVRFHTKAGAVTFSSSLEDFFTALAPLTFTFDPKVLYDPFADRFLIVTLEMTDTFFGDPSDTSRILLAVSDDGDPNGTWNQTAIDAKTMIGGTDHWSDFPGFALDEEAVYLTTNMFEFFPSGAFGGVRLWIVDKGLGSGGFYDSLGTALVSINDPYAGGGFATTTQPAQVFCTPGFDCSPTVGTYLVSYSGLTELPPGVTEFLQVVRVDDPLGVPVFTQEFVSIGDLEDFLPGSLPDAPQLGTGETIEVNDRRALAAVWRKNKLYMTATVELGVDPAVTPATAYWWILDTTTPGTSVISDQGAIDGEDITLDANPISTYFPAISVNAVEEVAIGFSASSSTIFPGSYYTTRKPTDTPGTNSGSAVLGAGTDFYIRTFDSPPCQITPAQNRWGDYSGAALDPIDQCMWVYNQHAMMRGTNTTGGCNLRPDPEDGRWTTRFGKVCIDCQASPLTINTPTAATRKERAATIIVEGAGDVLSGGDLTLEGQTITFENGFTAEGDLTVFTGFCPL